MKYFWINFSGFLRIIAAKEREEVKLAKEKQRQQQEEAEAADCINRDDFPLTYTKQAATIRRLTMPGGPLMSDSVPGQAKNGILPSSCDTKSIMADYSVPIGRALRGYVVCLQHACHILP